MKLSSILTVPFAVVADVVTLGNMGERTYTSQVFDAERREQRRKEDEAAAKILIEFIRALK